MSLINKLSLRRVSKIGQVRKAFFDEVGAFTLYPRGVMQHGTSDYVRKPNSLCLHTSTSQISPLGIRYCYAS